MDDYWVYVDFAGKKLKIKVTASHKTHAENLVKGKLKILKVEQKTANTKLGKMDASVIEWLKNSESWTEE